MKPRMRKRNCLWYCWAPYSWTVGIGYAPKQAYDDWLLQVLDA